jgi:hypothetical protein
MTTIAIKVFTLATPRAALGAMPLSSLLLADSPAST